MTTNLNPLLTACITMGRRPDLLRQTLESLGPVLQNLRVLAVNDFGDAETNSTFADICKHGELVGLGGHVGQHAAVDAMYQKVLTPYIFHLEDDWFFDRRNFLEAGLKLLESSKEITQVCFRKFSDFQFHPSHDLSGAKTLHSSDGQAYIRLDGMHPDWNGFSFNPHLIRRAEWEDLGGYSGFRKERHISMAFRGQGRYLVQLDPGVCHHIGEEASVSTPKSSAMKKVKRVLRSVFLGPKKA